MLFAADDLQILDRVIVLIAVDVMDDLIESKRPADVTFHDDAMFVATEKFLVGRPFGDAKARLRVPTVRATRRFRRDVMRIAVPTKTLSMASAHAMVAVSDDVAAAVD